MAIDKLVAPSPQFHVGMRVEARVTAITGASVRISCVAVGRHECRARSKLEGPTCSLYSLDDLSFTASPILAWFTMHPCTCQMRFCQQNQRSSSLPPVGNELPTDVAR
mmetsp:Transcript_67797/g.126629  ORF Transcript_67797/g.126629 Transcript_67797/m.126629 type:complete len:108 (+) Transcript_67797:1632-1955(+)